MSSRVVLTRTEVLPENRNRKQFICAPVLGIDLPALFVIPTAHSAPTGCFGSRWEFFCFQRVSMGQHPTVETNPMTNTTANNNKIYRVGIIGRTGKGGYGHALDTAWSAVPQTRVVAVSDDN